MTEVAGFVTVKSLFGDLVNAGALHSKQNEKWIIMKTITCSLAAVSACFVVSAAGAHAGDWSKNLYIDADAGAIFQQDADFHENSGINRNVSFDPGVRGDIAIGYKITQSVALELESGYMWNSVDSLNGFELGRFGESIDMYHVPLLMNLVYQFPTKGGWTPYVSVGAGADIGCMDASLPHFSANDQEVSFAYQAQAGLKYQLTDNATLGLAYKFYGTTDQDYDLKFVPYYTDHTSFEGNYIHGIFVNLAWNF